MVENNWVLAIQISLWEIPLFLVEFEINTLRKTLEVSLDLLEAQKHRLEQLNELEEIR